MAQAGKRLTWKFWTSFLIWTAALGGLGYFLLWDEIKHIRDTVPIDNRVGKDNCYDNPLLSMQIWTKDGHFNPLYKMQEVADYFNCLETEEALNNVCMFYITYNIGGLVLLMGFFAFLLVIAKYTWRWAIELMTLPWIFGIGEGVFISVLADNFKKSGNGGLSEVHCELCSAVGLIFWALFGVILILCIYAISRLFKQCFKHSRDRQRGTPIKTLRDEDSSFFRISEIEFPESGKEISGLF